MQGSSTDVLPSQWVLPKVPTGIQGLDEITGGGLPRGRPTLVTGNAGCGKTLLGMEFLVRGIQDYGEPGVFLAFEETPEDLAQNVRSLGFNLDELQARGQIFVEHVRVERSEIEETGEYDLEGLFVRLSYAIDAVKAQRVVIDTIEVLFAGLTNALIIRAELRRLFRWLKDKGVTAIITGERGDNALTRHGLEEYVSDCVLLLDNRVIEQMTTRRMRIVKYRGSTHGTNEYPFLIDKQGISVLPITSLTLDHPVSHERISTGIPQLDAMLGGAGYYRGSSILITGTAGSGKTSLAAHFADAACARGERCLYLAFEESAQQVVRNMASIGLDLKRWQQRGLLQIYASRPTAFGLEMHLVKMHQLIIDLQPSVVIMDPVTNLTAVGSENEVMAALMRYIDFIKMRGITGFFTSLTLDKQRPEQSEVGISSLMDTWILLRNLEHNGERNRGLYVLKSRGMAHSNQIREFVLTDHGIELVDVYLGTKGVLFGTARITQEAREREAERQRQRDIERRRRELSLKRDAMETQIATLRAEFKAQEDELENLLASEREQVDRLDQDRAEMAQRRGAAIGKLTAKTKTPMTRGDAGNGKRRQI